MNLDKINQKLNELKESQEKRSANSASSKDLQWKPEPGESLIRILPDVHRPDFPFSELHFYYDFGRTYLSPHTTGDPDPVLEFVQELRKPVSDKQRGRENWELSRKLTAKSRIFVPIIIRGRESEGVKFWSFGKTIYQELLSTIADPDFGDITDLKSGHDLVVSYKKASKEGAFPEIKVRVKPSKTKATDDPDVLDKIKNMPDIMSIFTKPTYEELKAALQSYLSGGKEVKSNQSSQETENDFDPQKIEHIYPKNNDTVNNISDQFDDLFKD